MKKTALLLALLTLLTALAACGTQPPPAVRDEPDPQGRAEQLYALSVKLTEHLSQGEIDDAMAMMDEAMTGAMDGKLGSVWAQLTAGAGPFEGTGDYLLTTAEGYEILEMTLVFKSASLVQRVVFDGKDRVSGLFFREGEVEKAAAADPLPDGVREMAVTVDAGDGFPLQGLLTVPAEGGATAAVILVHGSGPSDKNASIGANAPFQDLAHALAGQGIAVLRYDKRTYTHGAAMAANGSVTIDEEAALDAVAAVKLAKAQEGIRRVYLLGHSMSGGLLSYINALGADCAGYILLAGSPRNLWELSAEQNLLVADEQEKSGDGDAAGEIRDFVAGERLRAEGLASLSPEETLFGMPVGYLQELAEIDAIGLHLADGLPLLILQGERDRQVTMTDFALWKEGLEGHPDAGFISYPALNHLFGEYTGDPVPFTRMTAVEYAQKTPVPQQVTKDIADWIEGHGQ